MGYAFFYVTLYLFYVIGLVISAVVFYLLTWIIKKKDPDIKICQVTPMVFFMPILLWSLLVAIGDNLHFLPLQGKSLSNAYLEPLVIGVVSGIFSLLVLHANMRIKIRNVVGMIMVYLIITVVIYFFMPAFPE